MVSPCHNSEKHKDLTEWDHVEVDWRGSVTLRTIKSDARKNFFFDSCNIEGMPGSDEPLVHVDRYAKNGAAEEQKGQNKDSMVELEKDGDEDFVML